MSRTVALFSLVALTGCAGEASLDAEAVAAAAVADLSATLDDLGQTRAAVQRAEVDRSAAPDATCSTDADRCTWCTDWSGRDTQGVFSSSPLASPCQALDVGHVVVDGWLDGSWSQPLDRWRATATGARDLQLVAGDRTVDSYLTIASLDAAWNELDLEDWSTVLHYEGSRQQRWTVDVAGLGTTFVGTVTANTGERCTVYGELKGSAEVHCDRTR